MIKINNYLLLLLILILLIIYTFTSISIHPLIIIIFLIIYSIIICFIISIWTYNFIFSIITFLIIIRGLLIIFLYFSRLIPNIKIKLYPNILLFTNFCINLFLFAYLFKISNILNFNFYLNIDTNKIYTLSDNLFSNLKSIYLYPFYLITLLSILFLLLALFIIIKLCSTKYSPFRKLKK